MSCRGNIWCNVTPIQDTFMKPIPIQLRTEQTRQNIVHVTVHLGILFKT